MSTTKSSTFSLIFVLLFLINFRGSDSCSCMMSHPQEHFCFSTFVALVHVGKANSDDGRSVSYQIRVKRVFKANAKATQALSSGLIWTPKKENLCGLKFERNTRFLLTGTVNGEKAWVTLCNFVQEWSTLTLKQRKGFKKLYNLGCACKVRLPMFKTTPFLNNSQKDNFCTWNTVWDGHRDCESLHSLCVPTTSSTSQQEQCQWVSNKDFRFCLKTRKKGSSDDGNREIEDSITP